MLQGQVPIRNRELLGSTDGAKCTDVLGHFGRVCTAISSNHQVSLDGGRRTIDVEDSLRNVDVMAIHLGHTRLLTFVRVADLHGNLKAGTRIKVFGRVVILVDTLQHEGVSADDERERITESHYGILTHTEFDG